MKTSKVFHKILSDINSSAIEVSPRAKKVRELINYTSSIENPLNLSFDYESRKFSWKYLAAELIWYLSWDLSVDKIWEYAQLWKQIADDEGTINSNYWFIVFKRWIKDYENQYKFILETLIKDKDSRQAVMRYNSHEHIYKWNTDMVCTLSNQLLIRDNKINIIINMRSQDIFYWRQFDIVRFWLLLQSFRLDLIDTYPDLKLWKIYHNAGSIHFYENMFETAEKVINEEPIKDYLIVLNKSLLEIYNEMKFNSTLYRDKLKKAETNKKFIQDNLYIDIL